MHSGSGQAGNRARRARFRAELPCSWTVAHWASRASVSGKPGMRSSKLERPARDALPEGTGIGELDLRKSFAKARLARFNGLVSDLGGDPSHAQMSLVERVISLEAWIVGTETRLANGDIKDGDALIGLWLKATTTLLNLYRALGLKRRPRDEGDLKNYLREQYGNTNDHSGN